MQFESYLALLLKWNARLNLTAIRDPATILHRHFVECIQCAQALPDLPEGSTLLDFGSGAGLPGVPIAICRPDIRITLAESQGKKAAFLKEVVRALSLNAEVIDERVEEMPSDWQFDIVTLRAVDKMPEACRAAAERMSQRGWIVAFSTTGTANSIKAVLPEIEWQRQIPLSTLNHGLLLFGQHKR
ncbi:MAG: 16S rRNA (guanine(527)-N(7))-methyltransferase RsmG [Silvibacterium sp.]